MKQLIIYLSVLFFCITSFNLKAQNNTNTATTNLHISNADNKVKYKVVVSKPPNSDEDDFTKMATAYTSSENTTITFPLKEAFVANFSIYIGDSTIGGTSFICGKEPIYINFNSRDNSLSIVGGENEFYFEHQILLFEIPAVIVNDRNYNRNTIKEQYEIAFTNPFLKFKYIEYERNIKNMVAANKEKFFVLYTLWNRRSYFSTKCLQECFNLLTTNLQTSTYGKSLQAYIEASKNLFIGQQLPLFKVKNTDNVEISSEGFHKQSKYTLIHFWATWCKPCIEQMKSITALANQVDSQTLKIINISFDTDADYWKRFIQKDTSATIHYIEPKGIKGSLGQMFGITDIPRNIIIDSSGKIVANTYDKKQLESLIKSNQ